MADAVTNTEGPPAASAAAFASRRVGSMRLSRISRLCAEVNRPAIDAPARWITASTPLSRSGAGLAGSQYRSSLPRADLRTSRITRCPPLVRNADNAEPTRPDAPLIAITRGTSPLSAARRCAARSSASWRCR